MRFFIAACTLLIVTLQQSALPELKDLPSSTFLVDQFVSTTSDASWIRSRASKDEATPDLAQYDGKWSIEVPSKSAFPNDYGLVMKSKARHHAIAKSLNSDFDFKKEKSLIVQYEVRFQDPPHECGGAYVKLLTSSDNEPLDQFSDSRPYTVMFGPDKCGHNHKLHFIVRFKNPLTGIISEHHSSNASSIDDKVFSDGFTHLYRLRIDSNDDFITFVDNERVQSGNLRTDLEPPIVPPEEIDDELDQKPDSWDDKAKSQLWRVSK